MDHQTAIISSSSSPNTSRQEVIKKRNLISFGVKRLAMTFIDGTHQLISGESFGMLSSELDSTKAQLEAALAQVEKDKRTISGLTRRKQEVEADVIWYKDKAHRSAQSLQRKETACIAKVTGLMEALEDSDHRLAEVKIASHSLQKQVHALQDETKRFESLRLELFKSESDMQEKLCFYSAKAESEEGKVKGLKSEAKKLKEEKSRWRDRFDHMQMVRQGELRIVKEKDLLIESLRSEVKAKDILVQSLWQEVYEPTETSVTVQRLRKAENKIEELSTALRAKESIISNLNKQIEYVEHRVYEKDCELLESEARVKGSRLEIVNLSNQNSALRSEVVRLGAERQAGVEREGELRAMVGRAGVRMYQAAVEIARLNRHQEGFGNELTRLEGVAQAESERVEEALSLARETEVLIEVKDAAISDLNLKLALVTPLPQSQGDSTDSADIRPGAEGATDSSVNIACQCSQLRVKVTELEEHNEDLAIKLFEKDCKVLVSEARNSVLRSENKDLSRQIGSEKEAIVALYSEVEDLVKCLRSENEQLRSDVAGLRVEKRPRRLSLTG